MTISAFQQIYIQTHRQFHPSSTFIKHWGEITVLLRNEFASKAYIKIVLKEMQHKKVCVGGGRLGKGSVI